MIFDLDARTVALSVGEFADFSLGPRDSSGGPTGIWRAQLGTHWHQELRARATTEHAEAAQFELPVTGRIVHRGWTFTLTGRIDQLIRAASGLTLREIKSVTRPLPADEADLRRSYPEYFVQLAAYAALFRLGLAGLTPEAPAPAGRIASSFATPSAGVLAELVFVETDSGLAQTIALTTADESLFRTQLERVGEFLDLRLRARQRLRALQFRPAFAAPRRGQETTRTELTALFERRPLLFFEAPTGFGKTGILLEFALTQLRSGHFDRVLYLTSKSTGQLQVVRTLSSMTAPPSAAVESPKLKVESPNRSDLSTLNPQLSTRDAHPGGIAFWQVRAKSEHCVNAVFHCVRDQCAYLADAASRWAQSGLSRFYLGEREPRDLEALRAAGRGAHICPYEITRAALAFNDVWIGDYNYVFAPRNRGLFFEQPGFTAARTLLLIDEAHNLPARVADAYSHAFTAAGAYAVRDELHRVRSSAGLTTAWDHWCHFLQHLSATDALAASAEDDARHLLNELARAIPIALLDFAALGAAASEAIWQIPALLEDLSAAELPRLWWSPREGELMLTCLDAGSAIGATLREFGGVVLASATLTPADGFAEACGLTSPGHDASPALSLTSTGRMPAAADPDRLGDLTKRATRKLYRQLTSAAELLRVEEEAAAAAPALLRAHAPWREGSYDVVIDARVDTSFQLRSQHYTTTALTIAALAARGTTAVFFPSYAYADAMVEALGSVAPDIRIALQPKRRDLAAQAAWVDESLLSTRALFLVLGSSFAESIDALGGRVELALVVGPALPEVNAVQRARLAEATRQGLSRATGFRKVYQIPGMTKVNQALGRLVRAPGQRARVVLHCRRFLEPSYTSLLAEEYRHATAIRDDTGFAAWLKTE